MSSYGELKLGTIHILSSRNCVNPLVMTLFRENDKKVFRGTLQDLKEKNIPFLDNHVIENGKLIRIIQYSANTSIIRDRLELMGFTLRHAEDEFYTGLKVEIERCEQWGFDKKRLNILKSLDLESWVGNIKIIAHKILCSPSNMDENYKRIPIIEYMLTNANEHYGFPGTDFRDFLRILVEIFQDKEILIYDLTDLVEGGWISESDSVVENADEELSEDLPFSKKIIVLTEGDTDRQILQSSLKLLYPNICEYFHFLDSNMFKVEGGAGFLANIIKAFAGAGIINRIVAIFDNDTAAESAIRSLSNVKLPKNIVVKKYPYLASAANYPTEGPTGFASQDINGLACSIELYLGSDILVDANGELTPIQWKSKDLKLKKYQGEIINKIELQNKFKQKIIQCEKDPKKIDNYDWEGIRLIINEIASSFH